MRREAYTVALICALPIEAAAMCDMLDEEHRDLPQVAGDNNLYTLGRIGIHNVVIARFPEGSFGPISAAVVGRQLRTSFPEAKLRIMVGVGGGIPSEKNDIRLGDVVVSKPSDNSGGVIQYDFGKTEQGAEFRITRQLNRPPDLLLAATGKLHTRRLRGLGSGLETIISDALKRNPELRSRCTYPGADEDELFEAAYDHPVGQNTCENCDREQLTSRRGRSKRGPVIFSGTIASGSQVIKHGLTRDTIAKKHDLLCFEMEAAGLMNDAYSCLVVRGICDYADSHKTKDWQPYAAVMAAAHAREILEVIPAEELKTPAHDEQKAPQATLIPYQGLIQPVPDNALVSREAWQVQQSRHDIWRTLLPRISDYVPWKTHRRIKSTRVQGTAEWFLRHSDFQQWLSSTSASSLWCSGAVGSGKTMICTSVIDHIQALHGSTEEVLAFFYCETAEQKTLTTPYVLKSLIRQLLEHILLHEECAPKQIQHAIEYFFSPSGPEPDLDDIAEVFGNLFQHFPHAVYIIDGLDELEGNSPATFLSIIYRLQEKAAGQKILIASRNELGLNVRPNMKTRIENDGHDYSEVVKECWRNIEALWLDCLCDEDIERALENLPRDLPATYDRCVARIPENARPLAAKVLRWIAVSSRPLQVQELQEAVSFDLNDRSWNPDRIISSATLISSCSNLVTLDKRDRIIRLTHPSVKQYLVGMTPGHISGIGIEENEAKLRCGEECINYLRFSNFTLQIQRYASESSTILLPPPASVLETLPIAKVASRFSGLFSSKPSLHRSKHTRVISVANSMDAFEETSYAFLNYARAYWATSTKSINATSRVWNQFQELLVQSENSWKTYPWAAQELTQRQHLHGLLLWATRENHMPLLEILFGKGKEYNVKDFCDTPCVIDGLPALHTASRLGFEGCVGILSAPGRCDLWATGPGSRTAFHYAAEKNHVGVVIMLLRRPRNPPLGHVSETGDTALGIASRFGFYKLVEILLTAKAPLSPSEVSVSNPLIGASANGHADIVELLLPKLGKSEVDRRILKDTLRLAVANGYSKTIRTIIEFTSSRAAWVGLRAIWREDDEYAFEILSLALVGRSGEVLADLLDRFGADNHRRALFLQAVELGNNEALTILRKDRHLIPDFSEVVKKEALDLAANKGHEATVKLLLGTLKVNGEYSPFGNIRLSTVDLTNVAVPKGAEDTSWTENLIWLALEIGNEASVKLLCKSADVKSTDVSGRSLLAYAAKQGQLAIVKALLDERLLDPNTKCKAFGFTPLHYAVQGGHTEMVKLLLEHEWIDPGCKDFEGRTPLFLASGYEHGKSVPLEILKMLASRDDVDVNWREPLRGFTPLFRAAERPDAGAVAAMLQNPRIDTSLTEHNGLTPMEWASMREYTDVVEIFERHMAMLKEYDVIQPLSGHSVQARETVKMGSAAESFHDERLARGIQSDLHIATVEASKSDPF
ncbi:hypothetical protein FH972_026299 [Carpinus fangiana]|uniref:Uncharacterized protein n=1 Tax=Carpinus fangiana TaxID=176857 RepID=A0A5N6L3J1_9ROSI|nr:hypothetical protein FH972_026299 [Carpinus fangiana]